MSSKSRLVTKYFIGNTVSCVSQLSRSLPLDSSLWNSLQWKRQVIDFSHRKRTVPLMLRADRFLSFYCGLLGFIFHGSLLLTSQSIPTSLFLPRIAVPVLPCPYQLFIALAVIITALFIFFFCTVGSFYTLPLATIIQPLSMLLFYPATIFFF